LSKFVASFAVVFALLLPIPAMAVAQVNRPAEASGKAKADPNKVICRSQDMTGSRLSQVKRCLTRDQWAQEKQLNQQEIERIQANRYKSS
jgi:hypothetical protein